MEPLNTFPTEWENHVSEVSMQGGGIRQQVFGDDSELSVRFYLRPLINEFKTEKEGFKVLEYKEHVRIQRFGDKSTVYDQPASQEHIKRFPQHYRAFKEGKAKDVGVPLEAWDYQIGEQDLLTFKLLGIEYVHEIAGMSEEQQKSLGMDQRHLVARAKITVAELEDKDASTKLQMKFSDTERRLREVEEQNARLMDLMTLRSSERVEREMKEAAASPVTSRQAADIFDVDVAGIEEVRTSRKKKDQVNAAAA